MQYEKPEMELVMLQEAEVFTLDNGGSGDAPEVPVNPQSYETRGGWL